MGSSFTQPTSVLFHPKPLIFTACWSQWVPDWLAVSAFFCEHFYTSGKLLWNIFSTCLAVVLYFPVFVLYSISLIFDSYLFLFLIAFPTLLLNFFAFKNSFRVFIKECYILSWSLYHIFKLLPGYLKVFYPFSFSTYFLMQFSSLNFRWYYELRPLHAVVEN